MAINQIEDKNEDALLITKKISGNLKDCLKSYNNAQLMMIIDNLLADDERLLSLSKKEKIDLLDNVIKKNLQDFIEAFNRNMIRELDELLKNKDYQISFPFFLYYGIIFAYREQEKIKYYMPEDIQKLYQNIMTEEFRTEIFEIELQDLFYFLHLVYGVVSLPIFHDVLWQFYNEDMTPIIEKVVKNEKILIKNNQKYYWPSGIKLPQEIEELEFESPIYLEYDTCMSYALKLDDALKELSNELKLPIDNGVNEDLLRIVAMKPRKLEDVVDELIISFHLNIKKAMIARNILEKIGDFRYWSLGGRTIEEEELNEYLLGRKPKKKDLESCILSLPKKTQEKLKKMYEAPDVRGLAMCITATFRNQKENLKDCKEKLLNFDQKPYLILPVHTSFITTGCFYIYQEKDENILLIPEEIEEELQSIGISSQTISDYVFLYMMMNGIIKRQKLHEILKNYHGFDITLEKLDEIITRLDFMREKDYYFNSILENTIFEKEIIIKQGMKPHKIVEPQDFELLVTISNFKEEIKKIITDEITAKAIADTLLFNIQVMEFSEEKIFQFIRKKVLNISKIEQEKIEKVIKQYKSNIPLWGENGYSYKELSSKTQSGAKKTKVGRNDPCPCGSGKKYKKCCGRNA